MANRGDSSSSLGCSGRMFSASEIALIQEVVASCGGLSRKELANTVSELVGWTRSSGLLKEAECLKLLAQLEAAGLLRLPAKQATRPVGSKTSIPRTGQGEPGVPLNGQVEEFAPVRVEAVSDSAARQRFRELIDRYHPLGYKVPFGGHLEYLLSISQPEPTIVGCLQFSSAAWRIEVRDRWIGWNDATRARHLPLLVNNSRFLILSWVHIKNLATASLARVLRRLPQDWQAQYGVTPLVVETFVDREQYRGTCYRAANWLELGETSGRGRDDRQHQRHGARPKRVFVYLLRGDARVRLRGERQA